MNNIDYYLEQFIKDPVLAMEMEAAARWGVYHGHFQDWPPEEQAKCMAFIMHEQKRKAEHCSMCGTKPDSWLDDEGRFLVPAPFVAEWENCPGCTAVGRREKDREKQLDMDKGMRVVLKPNPEASDEE